MVKDRVILTNLTPEMWEEKHSVYIESFLTNSHCLLVAYVDPINGLTLDHKIPTVMVDELSYFVRKADVLDITDENFLNVVQYGTVSGQHIESLLRLMTGIYAPLFFENTSWPDSIKNDFSAQLHKFLASLTDTRWKMEGKTVLYIPNEGLKLDPDEASKNKELVQRLESMFVPLIYAIDLLIDL